MRQARTAISLLESTTTSTVKVEQVYNRRIKNYGYITITASKRTRAGLNALFGRNIIDTTTSTQRSLIQKHLTELLEEEVMLSDLVEHPLSWCYGDFDQQIKHTL